MVDKSENSDMMNKIKTEDFSCLYIKRIKRNEKGINRYHYKWISIAI